MSGRRNSNLETGGLDALLCKDDKFDGSNVKKQFRRGSLSVSPRRLLVESQVTPGDP